MKVVLMAGGRGTRISSIASDIPKPMIRIGDKPVLEHEIECLRDQGFRELIITVGHLGNIIQEYFGDGSGISPSTGKPFDVQITYYYETYPMGNAGALYELREVLKEDFLLLNGDVIFEVDFRRFVNFHHSHGGDVSLFTHPNQHPQDSGLLVADETGCVQEWLAKEDPRPEFYENRVNAGLHILNPRVLAERPVGDKVDLDRQILKPLAGTKRMYCYDSPEYVKDMGTPERYEMVCRDYEKGIIKSRNLKNPQKAIFLDRDGTLNRYVGFLRKTEELSLLPGAAEAIRKINASEYLAVLVTNQPVIARGEVTWEELREIHKKLVTLLGSEGAYLDGIYICPHHPHNGYEGEVKELKIDCDCRKPKPGMLLRAAEDLHIDLSASWMVGDSASDIMAGHAAGCRTAWIANAKDHRRAEQEAKMEEKQCRPDCTVESLSEFVETELYSELDEKGIES